MNYSDGNIYLYDNFKKKKSVTKTAAALLWPKPCKPQSSVSNTNIDAILHLLIDMINF